MKKLLSILGLAVLTTSSVTTVVSCTPSANHTETIHDKIKKSLQKPINFDDDWIIDYGESKKNLEYFTNSIVNNRWTLFNKLVTDLVTKQLIKDIPNLLKIYPYFSLSAVVTIKSFNDIRSSIQEQTKVTFNYDVGYNLEQLQDIPASDLQASNPIWDPTSDMLALYDGSSFGQFIIEGVDNQNQMSFEEKSFISDDKARLNYLSEMLNNSRSIVAYDGDYRKFLMMESYISYAKLNKVDFPEEDLVKQIHNDESIFNMKKNLLLKGIHNSVMKDGNVESLVKSMPSILDDIDIDISLVRAVLTSEIKADKKLEYVYGSKSNYYSKDMLVVNAQINLKKGDVVSDVTINEQLALKISYV
ncbi:lipoprotein [Spiroplasma sp. SV19]|uniref:lipoprotein n=1 Tax=Spiroplasma sp. SV19 TaxID=2570468 RepID=UPI0024B7E7D5|nr:lipoprotein [Spiroplasma sp. SV19]WHQ37533.1 hypothetical protein E7Y35_06790 [Spiroplasma sp. SV19]